MHFKRQAQHSLREIRKKLPFFSRSRPIDEALLHLKRQRPGVLPQAAFNFMVDLEFGMGNAYSPQAVGPLSWERRRSECQQQIENFFPLVECAQRYQLPWSWAMLSILLENPKLPQHLCYRPPWHSADWYEIPDFVEKHKEQIALRLEWIFARKSEQEILSHGHAHIDYSAPFVTEELAQLDLQTSLDIFSKKAAPVNAMVFPCNKIAHISVLKKAGIKIARGGLPYWQISSDLILTPMGQWVSPAFFTAQEIIELIDYGIEHRLLIHLWMHLNECQLHCRDVEEFYSPIFGHVRQRINQGSIKAVSFGQLAQFVRENAH